MYTGEDCEDVFFSLATGSLFNGSYHRETVYTHTHTPYSNIPHSKYLNSAYIYIHIKYEHRVYNNTWCVYIRLVQYSIAEAVSGSSFKVFIAMSENVGLGSWRDRAEEEQLFVATRQRA